jgi:hypothetical protein
MIVPNDQRTPSERRENAKKAGKASGKARREKSTLRAAFLCLLQTKSRNETEKKPLTGAQRLAIATFEKACKGDTKACKLIAEITGEYTQQTEIQIKEEPQQLTPQEAAQFIAELDKLI